MSDDQLRALYAKVLAQREPQSRDECIPPDALLALVDRVGPEDERLRTLDHAISCPACGRDLALLRAVYTRRPPSARRMAPYALAASILIIAGITLTARERWNRDDAERVRRGDAVLLISPKGARPNEPPLDLIWQSVPAAIAYDVTILDKNGTRVVERTTTDTSVTLGSHSALQRDADYAWTVTAHLRDSAERKSAA
ncbi:MAG: hypothetical protein ABI877_21485, partial [Gemmatimonadaceae bacterium]